MEWPTKTRQGGLKERPRVVTLKLYQTGGPIACFEKLLSKQPADLSNGGPLYLCPLQKERSSSVVFSCSSKSEFHQQFHEELWPWLLV